MYLNEFNVGVGEVSYLPLVSGLLRAYAETFSQLKENYQFMPFIYRMALPAEILANYTDPPDVAAFSSVMWNAQLNYHIAAEVKRRWPECLIVFGGPNVPMPPQHSVVDWMQEHRFIDVGVRAEGEESFADILSRLLESRDFRDIPGVVCRYENEPIFCGKERPFKRDLSELPSPYLEGLYDELIASGAKYQAIIETSRGCPFPCSFCYWGRGGLSRKFKYHDLDRVFGEVEWMGRNGIKYLFNADSNFGMNKRDGEIADYVVATKKKWGAPEKFRTCFGKNTDDKIFEIGALLHGADMEKGITLARQSNNLKVLENIQRQNIKMTTYVNLQKRFNDRNIPVYCELILGLPGETVESWKAGMDELIEAGTRNQIFAYLCQVFDNTELAEAPYREKFKIVTKRLKLTEIHCTVRPLEWVTEYEDIVVSTYSMTVDEWRAMVRFSYVMMLLHSLKIGYYLMIHLLDEYKSRMSEFLDFISSRKFTVTAPLISGVLDLYDAVIDGMLDRGEQRGTVLWDYGDFYWDMEEVAFLRLTQSRGMGWNLDVYAELDGIAIEFIGNALTSERLDRLTEVMLYQRLRIPSQSQLALPEPETRRHEFKHNIPEYFDKFFGTDQVPLMAALQSAVFTYSNHLGDKCQFARETILWGRKSGTMLVPCRYGDL